jgi:exopolyphosphatase/guanosine-5'-triphosphate,3'-diphosphate pyrophosphatase
MWHEYSSKHIGAAQNFRARCVANQTTRKNRETAAGFSARRPFIEAQAAAAAGLSVRRGAVYILCPIHRQDSGPMTSDPIASVGLKQGPSGLAYWMAQVLAECRRAGRRFDAEAVHDLRVALRRCRSMADGMMELDADPAWRKMKRASRKLFRRLSALRDAQVMMEWVQKLEPEEDPVRRRVEEALKARELEGQAKAKRALERFNRKDWRRWSRGLPERARQVPPDGLAFEHLALERWNDAQELHRRALRSRSRVAYHRLRIGVKRFRYTVENYLPARHREWGAELKKIQDLLGEVHDLDMLRDVLKPIARNCDREAFGKWQARMEEARQSPLDQYRRRMVGKESRWLVWRAGLPEGKRLEEAALAKLSTWAAFLTPDFSHAQRVAELALQSFDGFRAASFHPLFREPRARRILHGAALLHDVGHTKGRRGHHKASFRLIRDLPPPLGWTAEEVGRMALVARYHRGAEPQEHHEGYGALSPAERQSVTWLAGVLRFADSLDSDHTGRVTRVDVEITREAITMWVGDSGHGALAPDSWGGKRHLLESLCRRPVVVRGHELAPARSAD